MFSILNKKPTGETLSLKVQGMHCVSCAMNIDGALEDTSGVVSAETSYARSEVKICYQSEKITKEQLIKVIAEQGYQATE